MALSSPQVNCFVQSMARLSNTLSDMNTIINQTSELLDTFADSQGQLIIDVIAITSGELGLKFWAGQEARVQAVKDDAFKMAGDNSYQIDIGV